MNPMDVAKGSATEEQCFALAERSLATAKSLQTNG
jgi:hypothetical protein